MSIFDLDHSSSKKFSTQIEKYFYEDPELMQDLDVSYLSHVEKYENSIKKLTIILRKIKELIAQGQYGKEIYP